MVRGAQTRADALRMAVGNPVSDTDHEGMSRSNLRLTWLRGRVNVKAKTKEGLDAVGENRAAEAHVVVLIERQDP